MLKRIATQTFPPLFRPPQTYKCQDIICWIYFWWQRQKSCAYKQEGDLLRKYSCKCVVYLLQYRQLTPVAQQSLQTDSALILIFGSHTRGLSLRLWTKSVFRNRGSCSRISNLASPDSHHKNVPRPNRFQFLSRVKKNCDRPSKEADWAELKMDFAIKLTFPLENYWKDVKSFQGKRQRNIFFR